jgi:hypothetical protein
MWFRLPKRNTLRPRENRDVLLKTGLACVSLSFFFFFQTPLEVASTRAFYSSRSDSYNEFQGPTGGLKTGKTLRGMASVARSSI